VEGRVLVDAGVVDQHVEPAEGLERAAHHALARARRADVLSVRHRLAACRDDFRGDADRISMAPERVAPLVSALVRRESQVNGQVIVVGHGFARRATTVECDALVRVDGGSAVDASAQLTGAPLRVDGVCREFADALAAFEDFSTLAKETCGSGSARGSL